MCGLGISSGQFDPALALDRTERALGQVGFWVRDRDKALQRLVLEVVVAALDPDLMPARRRERLDNVSALHTHAMHTSVQVVDGSV